MPELRDAPARNRECVYCSIETRGSTPQKAEAASVIQAGGISADALEWVHSPLGYEIGSETVRIAASIVAELIACRNRGATIPEARVHVRV